MFQELKSDLDDIVVSDDRYLIYIFFSQKYTDSRVLSNNGPIVCTPKFPPIKTWTQQFSEIKA